MNHIMQKMITIIFCSILFVTFLVVIFSIVSGNERFLNNFVLTSFTRLSHEPAKVKKVCLKCHCPSQWFLVIFMTIYPFLIFCLWQFTLRQIFLNYHKSITLKFNSFFSILSKSLNKIHFLFQNELAIQTFWLIWYFVAVCILPDVAIFAHGFFLVGDKELNSFEGLRTHGTSKAIRMVNLIQSF